MAKNTIATTNGKRGGNLVGKPHKDKNGNDVGGIKAVVTDANGRPVELEGGEVIINKEASKKHWRELSRINQSAGNGVPIHEPIDPHDEDPAEYKEGGNIIDFNPNHIPNKWILKYAESVKSNHPEVWKLGGNIFGNQAFENLQRVSKRGYWLDSEKWMYIKWRSYVARHKGDFRIEGVIAMLKWVDKVDKGWQYMKNLIEAEIQKRSEKKVSGGKVAKQMSEGGDVRSKDWYTMWGGKKVKPQLVKGIKTEMEHKKTIEKFKRKGVSDIEVARAIAQDHLDENENYYEELAKIEKKFGKGGQTERQQAKIGYTMREFREGKLYTSYGEKVTDEKQALAIALSKAGIEKKGEGGTIEDAMTFEEAHLAFRESNGKMSVAQFPEYLSANGVVYKKGSAKKANGLRAGQYILASYSKYNNGLEFFKLKGFAKIRTNKSPNYKEFPIDDPRRIEENIIEMYSSQAELLNATGCKDLNELNEVSMQNNGVDFEMIFDIYNARSQYVKTSWELGNYWFIYDNRWARGSGAEPLSFIQYFPQMGDEIKTIGSTKREEEVSHELMNELSHIGVQSELRNDFRVGQKGFYHGKKPVAIEITKINEKNVYFTQEGSSEIKRSERKNFERLFIPMLEVRKTSVMQSPEGKMHLTAHGSTNAKSEKEKFIEEANKEIESWKEQESESKEQVDYYKLFKEKYEPMEFTMKEVVGVVLNAFYSAANEERWMTMGELESLNEAIKTIE